MFFHDNGCNPEIISRWILLAQSWASSQAIAWERARQIQFVTTNVTVVYSKLQETAVKSDFSHLNVKRLFYTIQSYNQYHVITTLLESLHSTLVSF